MRFVPHLHTALVLSLALAVPATAVFAQAADADRAQHIHAGLQQRFAAADTNGDGKLTKDEAKAKMPMVYKHFDEIDTAHTGAVTMAEIEAFARARHAARAAASAPVN